MKNRKILGNYYTSLLITILFTTFGGTALAQLSPGDLAKAHAELEGISNCVKCHDLGKKVSNDKCLNCHSEINSLINQKKGYHSSKEVMGKDCATCHSDHNGRNFDMTRFDEEKFNHLLAGYKLEGAHKEIDCRQCHIPDFIADRNIKKKESTFLGLTQECLSCHTDYHQKTLANDCAQCHNTEKFVPAPKFNHNKTDFALLGKHKTVECIDCHQKETRKGQSFQVFSGIAFANCNSCHEDVHQYNLGTNCKECHVEQSFSDRSGLSSFNHADTQFPLKGKHQQVNCAGCHNLDASPITIFQDRIGVQTNNCATCHKDVHENKFGNQCADCHNENSFRMSNSPRNFNHSLTGFQLEGKHRAVDCKACHKGNMLDPLPHNNCTDCHSDFHNGQLAQNGVSPDCAKCHMVDGFEVSLFSLGDHSQTPFPLDGAHIATPCFACHLQENQWRFRNIGEKCIDCHTDIHKGEINEKYYPNQSCDRCHLSTSWAENQFDHNQTLFKLEGKHSEQACSACHVPSNLHPQGRFLGLPATCTQCHDDEHHQQFDQNGLTDCRRCHQFEGWEINRFNHNRTNFKLTGEHRQVACASCHKLVKKEDDIFVQYKYESFACAVCHQ